MTVPVSAVIVSYNTRTDLIGCLQALAGIQVPLETIVVDNASGDDSVEAVRVGFPAVRLIVNDDNVGFARAVNAGAARSKSPYLLILNSDAEVHPGCVETLLELLESRPDVAVVGPRTLSLDGTPQLSFGPKLTPVREWRQRALVRGLRRRRPRVIKKVDGLTRITHEPTWVSGACMLVRRSAFEAVQGFDEGFFLYEEDVDFCLRLRAAGWRVLYAPGATVTHRLGSSMARAAMRAALEYHRSHLRFYRKHNPLPDRALFRAYLAATSLAAWLSCLGPGRERWEQRRLHRTVLTLALKGR